jgi:hypothetical protein
MKIQRNISRIYLFKMTNDKFKLAYGITPQDALSILELRLTTEEMNLIIRDKHRRIKPKDLINFVDQLG